ncbi:hypothetical protein L7F22_066473 [Adiantum nelumboides]|nr:hypothetical protein [Adiantum nelumboides]
MELESSKQSTKQKPAKIGKYVMICTIIATVSSTLLGYDIGVMSGALLFVSHDLNLNLVQQEIVVGSLNLISIVGGAMAGRLSDWIGRRLTMAIAAAIFFAGAAIMAGSPSFGVLLLGRLVAGIGVGFALMIAPVYSAELSPARIRGSLVSLTEVFINFGILLGYLVSFALEGLPSTYNWRLMLGIGMLPALLLAAGVLVMPESPRWLATQRRTPEARTVLIKTSNGDVSEANLRLAEILQTIGFDDSVDPTKDPTIEEYDNALGKAKKQGQGVWRELLIRPTPAIRRMLLCALGLHFFQQACGIDAAVYYSPVVFGEAGVHSRLGKLGATVGVGFCKFIFIFIATFLLDHVGRKPLLLTSAAGVTLSLFTVGTAFILLKINTTEGDTLVSLNTASRHAAASGVGAGITIFAICAYVALFSIGFGPVAWVFVSEIFPLRIRAQAVGLCVVTNRLVSGTVALTFLSISEAITPAGTFFLYGSIVFLSIIFFAVFMPETKGKTLEELAVFFEGRHSSPSATTAETAPPPGLQKTT